ncbi:MAG: hypothetical protein OXI05_04950 [Bacteroidota bacterium]|nr:hypothetical protein [Bacteroidota bacterium]MXW14251.1 hypothetical protein [Rhodothermaceae bacterium]MDE2645169.1 hypothetical protein [Bacteroidota bacterium]MXW31502.1 hypothetical protein [Rhodothermaceae bacterium]MXZ17679.1 hypothetical protein [Rhodothermaceae bacterium]
MAQEDNSTPIENLTTRAFVLLRKLVKTGRWSEAETIEYVEIQKEMPSANFESKLDVLNETLKAQNTKYNVLIWVIGGATVVLSTVITLLSVLGD